MIIVTINSNKSIYVRIMLVIKSNAINWKEILPIANRRKFNIKYD